MSRKHALSHAIKLAHSPKFFKAFPDLEEDAIIAVYDLCEDQDPNMRIDSIEGYKAIVRMSEEQPRWSERNVDVLVQLLQCYRAVVAVVKMAFIQDLELESKVTLGVLWDQIVPPDDPIEDEDKTIRERLRALVVAFLAQAASSRCCRARRCADRYPHQVSKSSAADVAKIIEDIFFLPSFNDGRRANELVHLLLPRVPSALREDLAPGRNPANLEQFRGYLELSYLLPRERRRRIRCSSCVPTARPLMGKMTLGRLSHESRAFFVARLAGALSACSHQKSPESSSLVSMRRQVVDALSVILPFFHPSSLVGRASMGVVRNSITHMPAGWVNRDLMGFLSLTQRKEQQTNRTIPAPLLSVLTEISRLVDEQQSPESKRALTRQPLPAKPPPPPPSPPPDTKEFVDAPPPSRRKAGLKSRACLKNKTELRSFPSGGNIGDSTTKFLPPAALFLAPSPVKSGSSETDLEIRQSTGSSHDTICSDVMCIECRRMAAQHDISCAPRADAGLDGHPTHVSGFGRNMGYSPMVVVWPSRGADGEYNSVALSRRKAPYEVMPKPDPHPPFTAKLSITDTYAPPDGMQNIIWAFSRTPPGSDDPGASISIHHKIATSPTPPSSPSAYRPSPSHPEEEDHDDDEKAEDEGESYDDENAEDGGESHDDDAVSGGSTASFVHGALCTVGFLLVLPSGALVARYAQATGSPRAFLLHRLLQFGVAGASITGGSLAYLFMENHGSSMAHKVGGVGLVLLYVVQCAFGSWVHRIPAESRTGARSALLAGLGGAIVLLAFFETWLGLISAGRSTLVWSALLLTVPALYVVGVMTVQRRFGSVKENAKGEYVALDTRPPSNDELEELEDGDEKL
ncbi:hypothetical protein EDB84DRAFT_1579770 [Lactarius hengduanensis]|nr:hypothetical protein EDB84DRAFT_1579770 [Lactarius hengduanensis]